jgi:anti-sigma factor RsiW
MKREPELMECDDEAAQLLPWFVNGTLSDMDTRRVATHLEQCETCRIEAAGQAKVQDLLQTPSQVEYAPAAGLRKLLSRIDESGRENPTTPPTAVSTVPGWRSSANSVRWLAAAVVIQAVALGTIAGAQFLGQPSGDAAAPYTTLTSVGVETARLRVVFVQTTTLAELQDLLRANQLVAVAGPSEAGIFALGFNPSATNPEVQAAVLARLRADPRVRFAEPLAPGGPPR